MHAHTKLFSTVTRGFLSVFVSFCLVSVEVNAGGLEVSPVRTYLSPQKTRQAIELRNPGDKPILVEVENFLWRQQEGKDQLTLTQDILTVPPVFTVAPGQTQIIRVGFRKQPQAEKELSYRIMISQVPDQVNPDQGINVVLRLSLPVFYTPRKTDPDPKWLISASGDKLQLYNAGLQHLQISKISVFSPAQPDKALAEIEGAGYVLPGATKSWPLEAKLSASDQELQIKMESNRGEMQNTVKLPR